MSRILSIELFSMNTEPEPEQRPGYCPLQEVPSGHAAQAGPGVYMVSPTLLPPGP